MIVITRRFFSEARLGRAFPPAINHPGSFHGFASVGLASQLRFPVRPTDPRSCRLIKLPAFAESARYAIAIGALFLQQRAIAASLVPTSVNPGFGMLFLVAFWNTREPRHQSL